MDNIELREERPFFTSVFHGKITTDYSNLSSNVLDLYSQDTKGVTKSNRSGWQSREFAPSEQLHLEWLSPLLSELSTLVSQVTTAYGILRPISVLSYWFNINDQWSYNDYHKHPGAPFASVFYFKVPENSGDIYFKRPDILSDYIHHDQLNGRNAGRIMIKSVANHFILFPGYLEHCVSQNVSTEPDNKRIAIGINFG
jgi:uncharacterized protein (TIGR02466 family)